MVGLGMGPRKAIETVIESAALCMVTGPAWVEALGRMEPASSSAASVMARARRGISVQNRFLYQGDMAPVRFREVSKQ